MSFTWNASSVKRMQGLHPDLVKVLNKFAESSPYLCNIAQGCRTADDEMGLWLECHNPDGTRNDKPWKTNCNGYPIGVVAPNGIQGTGVSNHQGGYAVDLAIIIDGTYNTVLENYHTIANSMLQAAASLNVPMVYGGSWVAPKTDSDHFELNRAFYPATEA
jgi:peptidoglycan L-alanyl-D-glutamate endopeptidase CwlK